MRIVLKSAEKDFVLSHAFGILPQMLWMMWLSSFDPKARIPLRSNAICLLPWDPNFESFGIVMWYSWNWKSFSDTNKAMFVCKLLVKVFTMHLTVRRGIQKNACHMIWRWIKQQLKEKGSVRRVLVKLSRLGSPGLTPLLSWVLLLRVGEILKVKLLEV